MNSFQPSSLTLANRVDIGPELKQQLLYIRTLRFRSAVQWEARSGVDVGPMPEPETRIFHSV